MTIFQTVTFASACQKSWPQRQQNSILCFKTFYPNVTYRFSWKISPNSSPTHDKIIQAQNILILLKTWQQCQKSPGHHFKICKVLRNTCKAESKTNKVSKLLKVSLISRNYIQDCHQWVHQRFKFSGDIFVLSTSGEVVAKTNCAQ